MVAAELGEFAPGVLARNTAAAKECPKTPRITSRARRRPEEMTEPGEEGVGVLLAEGQLHVNCSRLPIPFPENEGSGK